MIQKIICKNERSIKFFIVFGIILFMSILGAGGAFIYESFRDGNETAIIIISVSLAILVFCVFVPSFVYCKCEAYEPSHEILDSESSDSDSESDFKKMKLQNFV